VITFTEVTEVRRVREALQRANELVRLAAVLKDANDAITAHKPDAGI
jgi:hypothetical protein